MLYFNVRLLTTHVREICYVVSTTWVYKKGLPKLGWYPSQYIFSNFSLCCCLVFLVLLVFVSSDPDYARRHREIQSRRIALPKRSDYEVHEVKCDLDNFLCGLSTNVVDICEFGSQKKHEDGVLGKTHAFVPKM